MLKRPQISQIKQIYFLRILDSEFWILDSGLTFMFLHVLHGEKGRLKEPPHRLTANLANPHKLRRRITDH